MLLLKIKVLLTSKRVYIVSVDVASSKSKFSIIFRKHDTFKTWVCLGVRFICFPGFWVYPVTVRAGLFVSFFVIKFKLTAKSPISRTSGKINKCVYHGNKGRAGCYPLPQQLPLSLWGTSPLASSVWDKQHLTHLTNSSFFPSPVISLVELPPHPLGAGILPAPFPP